MLTGILTVLYNFSILTSIAICFVGFIPAYAFDETFNRQNQIRKLKQRYGVENRQSVAKSIESEDKEQNF
jgi:hypothetical protein